jgi:hypothetical protein
VALAAASDPRGLTSPAVWDAEDTPGSLSFWDISGRPYVPIGSGRRPTLHRGRGASFCAAQHHAERIPVATDLSRSAPVFAGASALSEQFALR